MSLDKLTIQPFWEQTEKFGTRPIVVLFNPNSYTIQKTVTWSTPQTSLGGCAPTERQLNAPTLTFGGGGSRILSLDLFFDVTEPVERGDRLVAYEDVRVLTDEIVKLTRIDGKLKRPPACEISWGKAPQESDFPFTGVVSSLTQNFTLFRRNGKPVRATLSVAFIEFLNPKNDLLKTDPELTTRVVRRGDTLSAIASEVYRDPALWRVIAEANRIDDPLQLEVGARLTVPKLQ